MADSDSNRLIKAVLVTAVAALVAVWLKNRQGGGVDSEDSPDWPPLSLAPEPTPAADTPTLVVEPTDGAAAPPPSGDWIPPDGEGGCPISHPVKVKLSSGIFHVPSGASYARTKADRCYVSPETAETDGYRASKT
ncbi:MAG: hypothetical protein ACR2PK_17730 [Acidimicrobiales bacterium]